RPDLLAGRLHLGKPFLLTNGRAIGKGVILSLLHFEKHAAEAKQQEEERTTLLSDPKKHITSYQEHPHRRLRKKKRKSK
ncbi:MAG: hypothetical protein WCD86_10230, partial [Ktedonobacteraceae bacterium]